jgi:NCS1 family nucleobase:cation symporter-1
MTVDHGEPRANAVGRVEAHGIDRIPHDERFGHPRSLFAVWAASNINFLYVVLGGLLIVFGLNLWQALIVVAVGNLFWAAIGFMATSGPVSGSPSSVITRSQFGIRGNRISLCVFTWPVFIAYEAVNLCLGTLAGVAVVGQLGLDLPLWGEAVILVVIAALTLVVSVYGHATIMRVSGAITVALALAMVVLGVFVVANTNWSYQPSEALTGSAALATMAAGVALIAACPLSWGVSPDYARYLPPDASRVAVASWTALGGYAPSVALGAVGALAGTAVDMSDAQTNLGSIVDGWFYPVLLLVIVIGSMANNVLTMYSSGLCLQAVGLKFNRSVTVLFDGVLGVAFAAYALFIANFTEALSSLLELTVVLLVPLITIYVVDQLQRRNAYDGWELNDLSPGGTFWYHRGFSIAGFAAFLIGAVCAVLCVNTTNYTGPVSDALGGADVSWLVGPIVTTAVYWCVSAVVDRGRITEPGVHLGGDELRSRNGIQSTAAPMAVPTEAQRESQL